jgi:hypothetical protein
MHSFVAHLLADAHERLHRVRRLLGRALRRELSRAHAHRMLALRSISALRAPSQRDAELARADVRQVCCAHGTQRRRLVTAGANDRVAQSGCAERTRSSGCPRPVFAASLVLSNDAGLPRGQVLALRDDERQLIRGAWRLEPHGGRRSCNEREKREHDESL